MSLKVFATTMLLTLLAWRTGAAAQSVVVLEFAGDKKFQVRGQVLKELQRNGKLEIVRLPDYKAAARKKRLRGPRAMTPKAVATLSKALGIDAAVAGVVSGKSFRVRILDADGNELWSKTLPVAGGKISAANVRRLGAAIAAAVGTPGGGGDAEEEQEEDDEGGSETPAGSPPAAPPVVAAPSTPAGGRDEASDVPRDTSKVPDPGNLPTAKVEERPKSRRDSESHTQTILDEDLRRPDDAAAPVVGPKLMTLQVAGTTTWRRYCSRPGVKSCREYDALPADQRQNLYFVDVSQQTPYFGVWLSADLFPFSAREGAFKGLGLLGSYSRGFSVTSIRNADAAQQATTEVVSDDESYTAQATYRYYFVMGKKEPLPAYGGVRAGLAGRHFAVDESQQLLHGSNRNYPVVGVDVSIPFAAAVRIEASGTYFLNPRAGASETEAYGETANGSGFAAEAGLGGDLWGPFGYSLRFKLASYKDAFVGPGQQWTDGGAAEETYTGLYWGATAHF